GASDRADGDDVADPELILEHHEYAVEHVLHDVLSPERESSCDDTGRGEYRSQIHIELAQDEDDGGCRHENGEHRATDRAERARALHRASMDVRRRLDLGG